MAVSSENLTLSDRRRALEYAAKLAALALEAPDERTKKIVYAARNSIQKLYGCGRDEKKVEILRLITLGAAQINDLIQESGFHRDDIYDLTKELTAEKRIRETIMKLTGGNGRPVVCYFPTDELI
jgi:hypothetical protein